MINQIRIRTQLCFVSLLPVHTIRNGLFRGVGSGGRGGYGLGRGGRSRTLYSSSDLERYRELLDKDVGDDGWEEDPEAIGEDPVDK